MGFNAGDLNLSIQASAEDTIKCLDAIIERLNLINTGLGNIKGNAQISKSSGGKSSSINGFNSFQVIISHY